MITLSLTLTRTTLTKKALLAPNVDTQRKRALALPLLVPRALDY